MERNCSGHKALDVLRKQSQKTNHVIFYNEICVVCTKVIHMSIFPLLLFLDVHKGFWRAFYYLFLKDYICEMGLSLIFLERMSRSLRHEI